MRIRVSHIFFIGFSFLCTLLVNGKLLASNCSGVFSGSQTNIDYDKYQSSVVRITSWLPARVSEDTIILALDLMSQDKELGEVVRPVIDRLNQIKRKSSSLYKSTISLFTSVVTIYNRNSDYLSDLRKHMELDPEYETNLKQVLEKITAPMGYEMGACPGVVVSHNTVILAAHCIVGRGSVFYSDGESIIEAKEYYYPTDVLALTDGMMADVGVVVFSDHTFDKISPVEVGRRSTSYDTVGVIGVKSEGQERIKKDVELARHQNFFLFQGREKELLKEGEFGMFGPLINHEGKIIGLSVGYSKDNKDQIWNLCVDFTTKKIQDFFLHLVREKKAIISGIK